MHAAPSPALVALLRPPQTRRHGTLALEPHKRSGSCAAPCVCRGGPPPHARWRRRCDTASACTAPRGLCVCRSPLGRRQTRLCAQYIPPRACTERASLPLRSLSRPALWLPLLCRPHRAALPPRSPLCEVVVLSFSPPVSPPRWCVTVRTRAYARALPAVPPLCPPYPTTVDSLAKPVFMFVLCVACHAPRSLAPSPPLPSCRIALSVLLSIFSWLRSPSPPFFQPPSPPPPPLLGDHGHTWFLS